MNANVHGSGLRPQRNVPPRLRGNPASAISCDSPSIAQIPWIVAGSSDSPIWWRGNFASSSRSTRCPFIATNDASVAPPGPPPSTTRS